MERAAQSRRRLGASLAILIAVLLFGGGGILAWRFVPCDKNPLRKCPPEIVAEFQDLFDNQCKNDVENGQAGQCLDLFYVTTRSFENKEPYFGGAVSDNVEMGRAVVSVPYIFKRRFHGADEKACDVTSSELDRASLIDACLEEGKDVSREKKTTAKNLERNRDDYDVIISSNYATVAAYTRAANQMASVDALDKVQLLERRAGIPDRALSSKEARPYSAVRNRRFFEAVEAAMDKEAGVNTEKMPKKAKSVMVYLHGFQTDFDGSLKTAGYLAADLNLFANPKEAEARDLALGVPVIFSWPTRMLGDDVGNIDAGNIIKSIAKLAVTAKGNPSVAAFSTGFEAGTAMASALQTMELNYFESQLRADANTNDFTDFVRNLTSRTGVVNINIVAHSMGNRIVGPSLENLADADLVNMKGEPVRIRIIHAAADIGRSEFENSLKTLSERSGKDRIHSTVYSSKDDVALFMSSVFQGDKKKLMKKKELTKNNRDAISRIDSIKQLLNKTKTDIKSWIDEDECRLGKSSNHCPPYKPSSDNIDINVIDASGFHVDLLTGGVGDKVEVLKAQQIEAFLAHGYFAYSPMVLSDMSCALRGMNPEQHSRSLANDDESSPSNWKLVAPAAAQDPEKVDPDCAAAGRLLIGGKLPGIDPVQFEVYFDTQISENPCSKPLGDDSSSSPPKPAVCDSANNGEAFLRTEIRSAAEKISDRPEMVMVIKITGSADCSNVSGEFDNQGLAERRADRVKEILESELGASDDSSGSKPRYKIITSRDTCVIESTKRDKNKRTGRIHITFNREPV